VNEYTDGAKTCLKLSIKSITPIILIILLLLVLSHCDKYATYAMLTCDIELLWNYFSVWFHV